MAENCFILCFVLIFWKVRLALKTIITWSLNASKREWIKILQSHLRPGCDGFIGRLKAIIRFKGGLFKQKLIDCKIFHRLRQFPLNFNQITKKKRTKKQKNYDVLLFGTLFSATQYMQAKNVTESWRFWKPFINNWPYNNLKNTHIYLMQRFQMLN